jgi:hypothetical protein
MSETSLHQALKVHYAAENGQQEVWVDGYQVDVVQGDLLIEIQTRNFSALKPKLTHLLDHHPVHLIHPLPVEKMLVTLDPQTARQISVRRSPRRGRLEDLFYELVRIPHLVNRPNFSLEVLLIREQELRQADGRGSWRRRGVSIVDRKLIAVLSSHLFASPDDYRIFLSPLGLTPFSMQQYASSLHLPPRLAAKAVYCLRHINLIRQTGKSGRSWLYEVTDPSEAASPPESGW